MINHYHLTLPAYGRGFHLITRDIRHAVPRLPERGIMQVFIKHTSAGLTINENADPDVLTDFESYFNHIVRENMDFTIHTIEGPDDMPAHIKASLVGSSVSVPIVNGSLSLGIWQGIYLLAINTNDNLAAMWYISKFTRNAGHRLVQTQ